MGQPRPLRRSNPGFWVAGFTLLLAATIAQGPAATTAGSAGIPHELRLSEAPLEQYRALRRMHALAENVDHEGWMVAWTEYDRRGFRYEIVSERGSGTVRNRVLKAILEREQELIAKGDFGRGDLTAENYAFGPEIPVDGVRYVALKPKRKDVMLVDGRMVLDSQGELLRVEGVLSKNPSFWTTRVDVVRHYTRLDGIRVPIGVESIAKVRFVGPSRLSVTYEYETINHRTVTTAALPPSFAFGGTTAASGR